MTTTGSWLMKNSAKNRNHDSEWSFSCRTTPYNAYSDSDSDTEQNNNSSKISAEAQLLNELDLSAREETVQYKPNPFSIAKINAASRGLSVKEKISNKSPSHTQRPSSRHPVPIVDRNKKKKGDKKVRPGASIIDKLKKQPQKATLDSNLKKAVPVTSFFSSVLSGTNVSITNPSKPESFDPLLTSDVDVEVTRPFHAVGPSKTPIATHISTSDDPACAIHLSSRPGSSQIAHTTSPSAQISLSAPLREDSSSHSDILNDEPPATVEDTSTETLADIQHDTFSVALPQNPDSDVTLIDAETFTPNAPVLARSSKIPPFPIQQGRDLDPSLSFNSPRTLTMKSTFNSKPKSTVLNENLARPRPLSLSSPPQQQNTRTPAFSSFTASSRFRAAVMSSPLRPADHLGPRNMSRMPVVPSHVATDASLGTPFSLQPLGRFSGNHSSPMTTGRDPSTISPLVHFTDNDYVEESAPSPPHTYEIEDIPNRLPFSPFTRTDGPSLSRFVTPLRKINPGRTMKTSQPGGSPSSGSGTGDIDDLEYNVKSRNTTPRPEDIDLHVFQGSMTPTESACVLPSNLDSIVYYPDTNHKRPCPGPGTNKGRPRPVKDAYDFLSSDPDENWGTLPTRKKVKTWLVFITLFLENVLSRPNSTPSPVMRTRKFRLPKLGLGGSKTTVSSKTEKTGMEANSARRVITFLPPPLKPASTRLESESKVVTSRCRAAYPSPSGSVLKASSSPMNERPVCPQSQRRSPAEDTGTKAYKPLSPPLSDSPCITPDQPMCHAPIEVIEDREGHSDVHTPIDLPSIARLYPDMKATWRLTVIIRCVSGSAGRELKRSGPFWICQVAGVFFVITCQM